MEGAVWGAGVHVRKLALHVVGGEHVDVLDAEGLEDVLLEVVVQGHAGHSLHDGACPVDVHLRKSLGISMFDGSRPEGRLRATTYPILPVASGFGDEW